MIDLHTHTSESDGSLSPRELVELAARLKLEALGITDHDTLAGYDRAAGYAKAAGLEIVCGIELTTRWEGRKTVHLLGYFAGELPSADFREWLIEMQAQRRERNERLAARLCELGATVRLEEVEALGRSLAGRPHFARLLVQKGYCSNTDEAFRMYLDESAPGYVERNAPSTAFAIQQLLEAGGIPVLAHPVRLGIRDTVLEERMICGMTEAGLAGIEAFHSDHSASDAARYEALARKLALKVTGGSDFHGDPKPDIALGSGRRNLNIPVDLLRQLRD